ncbi:MAG: PQQ-binding-like beta-propeller repeat protein, partial [Nitrososphaera sp.]|nr:PQQ-binding-like beta-propeller repeat protein [Nitrososphaera sp.]
MNPASGAVENTFQADSAIRTGALIVGQHVYVTSEAGRLYKLTTANLSKVWEYNGGSKAVTAA